MAWVSVAADGVVAVGQQHDPGRRRPPRRASSRLDWKFSIAVSEVKIASPIAVDSARSRLSIALRTCCAVGRRRHHAWSRVPAKDTSPRLIRSGRTSTNSLAAVCIASEPVGLDVGGLHRQRHVDGHDDRRPLPRHPHLGARHGQRRRPARPARAATTPKARCRRQPGPLGHERAEQRHVGEPRGVGLPAQLQDARRARPARRRRAAPSSHSGDWKVIGTPLRCRPAGGRRRTGRCPSASPGRCAAAGGRRRPGAAPAAISLALGGGALGEPGAELGVAGRHLERLAGLRVDDGEQPDVGQLQLARVDAPRSPAARAGPTARAAAAPSRCRRGSRRSRRPGRAGAAAGAASPAPRPGRRGARRRPAAWRRRERSSRSAASRPGIAG